MTDGALLYVVALVATAESNEKSIPPLPEKVKEEVTRSDCLGKRKIRLHVLPESEAGISKLKMDEVLESTVPC